MGLHYVRRDVLGLPDKPVGRVKGTGTHTDFRKPAMLVYEPQPDGSLAAGGGRESGVRLGLARNRGPQGAAEVPWPHLSAAPGRPGDQGRRGARLGAALRAASVGASATIPTAPIRRSIRTSPAGTTSRRRRRRSTARIELRRTGNRLLSRRLNGPAVRRTVRRLQRGSWMASLFLSYSREDVERVRPLATALEREGHSVWWDRHISGGQEFAGAIEQALASADVVVVCWTESSVRSRLGARRSRRRPGQAAGWSRSPSTAARRRWAFASITRSTCPAGTAARDRAALKPLKAAIAEKASGAADRSERAAAVPVRHRAERLRGAALGGRGRRRAGRSFSAALSSIRASGPATAGSRPRSRSAISRSSRPTCRARFPTCSARRSSPRSAPRMR